MYGVSTRRAQEVLTEMRGTEVSAMTVSRVAAELDEKLAEFRNRRLDGQAYPYLFIDARYEKIRMEGRVVSQAVLIVVGIDTAGKREILDWRIGDSESEATWGEIFRGLKDRGLAGVLLAVSDARKGLRAALRRHFQGVAWQRCRVHYMREMGRKVSYKALAELMRDLAAVFLPGERQECLRRGEEMAAKWEPRYPRVANMLREGLEDCLTVLAFPEAHRRRLTTTNMIERLMQARPDRKSSTAAAWWECFRTGLPRPAGGRDLAGAGAA
jgi:transposase-like protein